MDLELCLLRTFLDIPLVVTFDGSTYMSLQCVFHVCSLMPWKITPIVDIVVDEDAEPFVVSLGGTDRSIFC